MKVGNRIICDQDGVIIFQTGEMEGHVIARKEITELHCIDLEHGEVNIRTHYIDSIDVKTKKPILKEYTLSETDEQKHIRELENTILLQKESEIGGIL